MPLNARFLLVVTTLLSACTFPDVGFKEGAAGSTGSGGGGSTVSGSSASSSGGGFTTAATNTVSAPCYLPQGCANDAHKCVTAAASKYDACTQPCKGKADCIDACAATKQGTLALCSADCKVCAPAGCEGAVASCVQIVGQ
jgi:hypothetical protein